MFVRCAGCNLSCTYCDTLYAREGGRELEADEVIKKIELYNIPRLTITGGEPLLQDEVVLLSSTYRDRGYDVQIETNGSIDISMIPSGVRAVMDVKTPGSGMECMNNRNNFSKLRPGDEIKYVVTSKEDYEWSVQSLLENSIENREDIEVLFSPASGYIEQKDLAEWILDDQYPFIRFQPQLHKLIWKEEKGR